MISGAMAAYKACSTVEDFAKKYTGYRAASKVVAKNLFKLHTQPYNSPEILEQIKSLRTLENAKNVDSASSVVDLTTTGVKACVGPVGDVVADIAAGTVKEYIHGEDLRNGVVHGALQGVERGMKKEVRNTAMQTVGGLTVRLVGEAAAAAAIAWMPVAAAGALAIGGVAVIVSPQARQAAWEKGSAIAQGAYTLAASEFGYDSINEGILEAYDALSGKHTEIENFKTQNNENNREKKETEQKIKDLEAEISKDTDGFEQLRRKNLLNRFVYLINQPGKFYAFLNSFFSLLSSQFKEARAKQIQLKCTIDRNINLKDTANDKLNQINKNIEKIKSEILLRQGEIPQLYENYLKSLNEHPGVKENEDNVGGSASFTDSTYPEQP